MEGRNLHRFRIVECEMFLFGALDILYYLQGFQFLYGGLKEKFRNIYNYALKNRCKKSISYLQQKVILLARTEILSLCGIVATHLYMKFKYSRILKKICLII